MPPFADTWAKRLWQPPADCRGATPLASFSRCLTRSSPMARPLRFCFLTTFYPPYSFGGDAIFVSRLANALARRGHEVEVIHCVDSYRMFAKTEPPAQLLDHPNVTVH